MFVLVDHFDPCKMLKFPIIRMFFVSLSMAFPPVLDTADTETRSAPGGSLIRIVLLLETSLPTPLLNVFMKVVVVPSC